MKRIEKWGASPLWYAGTLGILDSTGAAINLVEPTGPAYWALGTLATASLLTMAFPDMVVAIAGLPRGDHR